MLKSACNRAAIIGVAAVVAGNTGGDGWSRFVDFAGPSVAYCERRARHYDDIDPDELRRVVWAVRDGEGWVVRRLLDKYRISAKTTINESGKTLLALAAETGHVAIVRILVERGAEVDATDKRGFTALEYAAWKGHVPCCEVLLAAGARVDTRDIYGLSPVHKASGYGHAAVVRLLLTAQDTHPDMRTGTVTAPADHQAAPNNLDAPLHIAARLGQTETVRTLLEAGADVDAQNVHRRSALHEAARKGHAATASALLCAGASKAPRSADGLTAAEEAKTGAARQVIALPIPRSAHCAAAFLLAFRRPEWEL